MQTTYGTSYNRFPDPIFPKTEPRLTTKPLTPSTKHHSISDLRNVNTTLLNPVKHETRKVSSSQNSVLFPSHSSSSKPVASSTSLSRPADTSSAIFRRPAPSAALSPPINLQHMFSQVAEITPNLFLSSLNPVRFERLRPLGITQVISAIMDQPPIPRTNRAGIQVVHVQVEDIESANLRPHFDRVADRIYAEEKRGGRTLVHCMAGVSRSASLVLAYLVKYQGMSLREAFYHARARRPYVSPNPGFWKQLLEFEDRIRQSKSVKLVPSTIGRGVVADVLLTSTNSHNTAGQSTSSATAGASTSQRRSQGSSVEANRGVRGSLGHVTRSGGVAAVRSTLPSQKAVRFL